MKLILKDKEKFSMYISDIGGVTGFAEKAQLSRPVIYKLMQDKGINENTAVKVASAMGKSVKSIFLVKLLTKVNYKGHLQ